MRGLPWNMCTLPALDTNLGYGRTERTGRAVLGLVAAADRQGWRRPGRRPRWAGAAQGRHRPAVVPARLRPRSRVPPRGRRRGHRTRSMAGARRSARPAGRTGPGSGRPAGLRVRRRGASAGARTDPLRRPGRAPPGPATAGRVATTGRNATVTASRGQLRRVPRGDRREQDPAHRPVPHACRSAAARLAHLDGRLDGAGVITAGSPWPVWRAGRLSGRYVPALRLAEIILDN